MTSKVYECNISSDFPFPRKVEGLRIDFTTYRPNLKIFWQPINPSTTDFNWTSYATIYSLKGEDYANCIVLPMYQTEYLLPEEEGWKYPNPFSVEVVTHPFNKRSKIELRHFLPKVKPHPPNPTEKDPAGVTTSIVGGLVAGLVLLIFLCLAVKWRKSRLCPEINCTQTPQATHRREDCNEMYYACYYPEGDEFRREVASIVNYFRQSGYNVIMDEMVSDEMSSQGPTRWAESQIRKAKKVLVFLSPGLINLAQDGGASSSTSQDINRVWIELDVLRDIYSRNRSASKMVCLTLPDVSVNPLPLPLWASNRLKWPKDAKKILKRLNDRVMILSV